MKIKKEREREIKGHRVWVSQEEPELAAIFWSRPLFPK